MSMRIKRTSLQLSLNNDSDTNNLLYPLLSSYLNYSLSMINIIKINEI